MKCVQDFLSCVSRNQVLCCVTSIKMLEIFVVSTAQVGKLEETQRNIFWDAMH